MKKLFVIILIAPFIATLGVAVEKTVFATQDGVKITSKASKSASVVTTVNTGDELSVMEESGSFYRVKTVKGAEGYVGKDLVSDKKPEGGGLDSLLGALGGLSRTASVEESSSSHSIRGLKKAEGGGGQKLSPQDAERAVEGMEKFNVSDRDLDSFQREGKVGRYAK